MNKKNNGCIYTRGWVVNLMLDFCQYTVNNRLAEKRVIEPACGDGSFVSEIVKRLCASARLTGHTPKDISGCIKAYDTDSSALASIREKTKSILTSFEYSSEDIELLVGAWFVNANYITEDVEKADLVIGNPPYIRATDLSAKTRSDYAEILETFTQGTDLYIAFMEKSIKSLLPQGKLCFICSDRWQKNQFGNKFRKFILREGFHVSLNCQMHEVDAFEKEVTAYPAITIFEQATGFEKNIICNNRFDESKVAMLMKCLNEKNDFNDDSFKIQDLYGTEKYKDFPTLEEAGILLGIGIATGKDSVFITNDPSCVEADRLLPLAYARDITGFSFPDPPEKWLVNPWEKGSLVELDKYPKLKCYFEKHREQLCNRHVAKKKNSEWYRTIDKVKDGIQFREKLLIRDMTTVPEPIYEPGKLYPHHNLYWMISDVWDIKVLGGILISDTVEKMMEENSIKMRGGVLRNQAQYLRKIRIPRYENINELDKQQLSKAFDDRDRTLATEVCNRLYMEN